MVGLVEELEARVKPEVLVFARPSHLPHSLQAFCERSYDSSRKEIMALKSILLARFFVRMDIMNQLQ
jgi:hypothetical protein